MNRIFVEKKAAHNAEARHLLHDLRESLVLPGLKNVRVVQRYDIDGLSRRGIQRSRHPHPLGTAGGCHFRRRSTLAENETAFAVEFLPGQFDQRADSAAQCVQILTGKERPPFLPPRSSSSKARSPPTKSPRIKSYVINAVDSHEVPVAAVSNRQAPSTPPDVRNPHRLHHHGPRRHPRANSASPCPPRTSPSARPTSATRKNATRASPRSGCSTPTGPTTAATPPSSPKSTTSPSTKAPSPSQRAWQTYLATRNAARPRATSPSP